MEDGWTIHSMAGSGFTMSRVSGLTIQEVTGTIQNMAGPGFPIMTGVGQLFTMEDGRKTLSLAGYGYQVMIGLLHG